MNIDDVNEIIRNFRCPVCLEPLDIGDALYDANHLACESCWNALDETKEILDELGRRA